MATMLVEERGTYADGETHDEVQERVNADVAKVKSRAMSLVNQGWLIKRTLTVYNPGEGDAGDAKTYSVSVIMDSERGRKPIR